MKPGKSWFAGVLCLIHFTAPAGEGDPPSAIPAEDLKADVRFLMQTFEAVHPNLNFKVSRAESSRCLQQLNDGLTNALTPAEFYYRLAPFVDGFEDGHTVVHAPPGTKKVRPASHVSVDIPGYPWKFEILDTNIGYLDFVQMSQPARFKAFLTNTFGVVKEKRLRGLIIDLRKNGGGDSSLGDDLLDYINDKPYRPISRKDWRFSPQFVSTIPDVFKEIWTSEPPAAVKAFLFQDPPPAMLKNLLAQNPGMELKTFLRQSAPAWLREYLLERAPHWLDPTHSPETQKETLFLNVGELRQPPSPFPLRFRGPVCFLVGPATFSSAVILGNSVEDFHLATLIGEETRPCNQFGEPYGFKLPHSGLSVWVATAQYVRANGDAASARGIVPDIEVMQSRADQEKGIDTALETAKRWIQNHP